ncbi:hypothetical protein LWI29_014764 [Acer saccharum]|uniref:Uncharacterized protein n=1 Tax=Acer saccharum TaxID=4024 RepID=A0AA39ST27_ACESA|nr:hypothetical protein LWI29_014764 [Acer saccharum]
MQGKIRTVLPVLAFNARDPSVYALNAKTGRTMWSYATGARIYGGGSVAMDKGNGYNKVSVGFVSSN